MSVDAKHIISITEVEQDFTRATRVADKIGYKKTMCFCCALYFSSKLVFWKADVFAEFLLERVMLSIVIAGLSGVDSSILYLSCNKGETVVF